MLQHYLGPGPSAGRGWQIHYHKKGLHRKYGFDLHAKISPQISKRHQDYFKFSIIRNPWSWLVSLYFSNAPIIKKRPPSWENMLDLIKCSKIHIPDQASWVLDKDDRWLVNHLCRFENFSKECRYIFKQLNLEVPCDIPHRLNRKDKPYYEYYRDDSDIKAVERLFQRDIDLFDYRFKD